MNIVILRGCLSRPAALRSLPSGDRLVALEVSLEGPAGRAESAPVVWPAAPASASGLDVGDEVVVVGRVRRRFFRAGGAAHSRTEVMAEAVVPARQARRARAAVTRALSSLEDLEGAPSPPRPSPPRSVPAGR